MIMKTERNPAMSSSPISLSAKSLCGICLDSVINPFTNASCNHHPFCTSCISEYVKVQRKQNVVKVNCPHPKCCVEIKPQHFQSILPKQIIFDWESAKGKKWKKCPRCSMHVEKTWGGRMSCRCGCYFCYICGGDWSSRHMCKQLAEIYVTFGLLILAVMFGTCLIMGVMFGIGLILGVLFGTCLIIGILGVICFILYQAQRGKLKGLKHELKTGKE